MPCSKRPLAHRRRASKSKDPTSRFTKADASVIINGAESTVRENKNIGTRKRPRRPSRAQRLLLRFWLGTGRPASINTLPSGRLSIEVRGRDTFTLGGKAVTLHRYSLSWLIWGNETVRATPAGLLIAMVGVDAEFDHFDAIRDSYEPTTAVSRQSSNRLDGMEHRESLSAGAASRAKHPTAILDSEPASLTEQIERPSTTPQSSSTKA